MRFITLLATLGLAMLMTLNLPAQTVRVIFTSGQASMHRPDEATPRPVVKGETIVIGTRIITGPDGRVVITPMPGVKSIIAPNTTLVLESVSETRTSVSETTHSAVLNLNEGSVVSDLQKPEGVTYDYSIRTARGLAGARGTTFTVGINAAGIQTIVVSHGTISLTFADGRTASLTIGQLSITKPAGETQSVNNIGELPEADQQAAQTFTETTISAIAEAISAGIELDTAALNNVLDAAKSLGITLPAELKTLVERVLTSTETTSTTTTPSASTTVTEVVTETVTPPDPYVGFRANLNATQTAIFNALPTNVKDLLVALNDPVITAVALAIDSETGLPYTYEDLRIHLSAFRSATPETLAFIKTLGGTGSDALQHTPDPVSWSPDAFTRTLTTWNALSSPERALIVSLGAGEAIMDVSKDYVSALLASLDSNQQTYITEAGWGDHLADLAGKPTNTMVFTTFASLTPAQRDTVKFFEIDPGYFYGPNITPAVQALTAASADQQTLRQLGVSYHLLDTASITGDPYTYFTNKITATLSFYNSLTTDQQTAVRALGLGSLLYNYAPAQQLGSSSITAQQRVADITQIYLNNPSLQQAMRDIRAFDDQAFLESGQPIDTAHLISTLNAYINLPERTRIYIATRENSFNSYALAQPPTGSTLLYRTLSEINSLLAGLTDAELETLKDLGLSRAILQTVYLGNPQITLQNTIGYFNGLSTEKKFVLRELGIIDGENIAILGADSDGLTRLLAAYAAIPGTLRASTERLDDYMAGGTSGSKTYGNLLNPGTPVDRSFFFPRGTDDTHKIQKIAFQSTGDLYIGATRYLNIDNSTASLTTAFTTGAGKDLYLYAADLIDLNSTTFAATIANIRMSAATINLTNITFLTGSNVELRSKLGVANFGSSVLGKVNFISNVNYGATAITNQTILNGIPQIQIGTLTP